MRCLHFGLLVKYEVFLLKYLFICDNLKEKLSKKRQYLAMEEENGSSMDQAENNRYLEEHHLRVYLEDSIAQYLSVRQDNHNHNIKPVKFFKEYFCSVQQGTHILFREYSFITSTPYNKLCVLKAIMRIYKPLLFRVEKLKAKDYHALLQLVWLDFQHEVVSETFASLEKSESNSEVAISFLPFIIAFRKVFCVGNFTYEEQKLYQQLLHHEEEIAKIDIDDPTLFEGSDKFMPNLSEVDLVDALPDNECESDASSWSLPGSFKQPSDSILKLCNSNSFSNDETFDAVGKLSHSYSGSKDSTKSEQGILIMARPTSGKGRLSNSLNLLQGEKDKQDSEHPMGRLRSKSAVTIQRNSPVLHKPELK